MDRFKIDGEKLSLHPERVAAWLQVNEDWDRAKKVYPLYVEISPIGICNHRCNFCSVDYIGYQNRSLDEEILLARLSEMARLGIKSAMYAGEGEPLLYKPLRRVIRHTASVGIDVAITTNAVALTRDFCEETLSSIRWIKASVNAGTAETYAKIHQTDPKDFYRALENMGVAANLRHHRGLSSCRLGLQMVLLPENASEAYELALRAKEIGMDYLVIKPYTQSVKGISRTYEGIDYQPYYDIAERLETVCDKQFQVVFRRHSMDKLYEERAYSICQATPFFWAYLMANGDLYGCSAYLEDPRFNYGSLHSHTFQEIWEGEMRRRNFFYVAKELDITECRKICRMDEANRYLWSVKNPPEHANFI